MVMTIALSVGPPASGRHGPVKTHHRPSGYSPDEVGRLQKRLIEACLSCLASPCPNRVLLCKMIVITWVPRFLPVQVPNCGSGMDEKSCLFALFGMFLGYLLATYQRSSRLASIQYTATRDRTTNGPPYVMRHLSGWDE